MAAPSADWSWLFARLQRGEECPGELRAFLREGGRADAMLPGTLGSRELNAPPCCKSLELLLRARADPNATDHRIGSPVLHLAAWGGTPEVASLLLAYRADIERGEELCGEEGHETPPLNTALAAGNAAVALLLLERRADAQWRHKDGASALHVATAWISDDTRAKRRAPPLGDEPRTLVAALLHHGADPSHREGVSGRGMTPLEGFREGMAKSPWLQDEVIGPPFRHTSQRIFELLDAADAAMRRKAVGNKAFSENRYQAALEAWAEGRRLLEAQGVAGHHVAVFWSNEATCRKRVGDLAKCRAACQAGLATWCAASVRAKLEFKLAECAAADAAGAAAADATAARAAPPAAPAAPADASPADASSADAAPADAAPADAAPADAAPADATPADAALAHASAPAGAAPAGAAPAGAACAGADAGAGAGPPGARAPRARAEASRSSRRGTALKGGFLKNIGESDKPMYGPKGSVQGKNHSDMVLAPVQGQMHPVPYGKVLPLSVPNPYLEKGEDDSEKGDESDDSD